MVLDLTRAKFVNEVTVGASNFSESTTEHRLTPPAGRRYFVTRFWTSRDQAATFNAIIYSTLAMSTYVQTVASGTGNLSGWDATAGVGNFNMIVLDGDLGDYLRFVFGAAQGASGKINIRYFEVSK